MVMYIANIKESWQKGVHEFYTVLKLFYNSKSLKLNLNSILRLPSLFFTQD